MPVDIVYGSPSSPGDPDLNQYVQELKDTLTYAYALVRRNLGVAANRRKRNYDMNARIKHFAVGDKVWVFVPRKRQRHYPKWEKYYQGPFVIVEQTGPLNFRVQKLPRGRTFVAHVDKLSRYTADEENESPLTTHEPLTVVEEANEEPDASAALERQESRNEAAISRDQPEHRTLRPRGRLSKPLRFRDE